MSRVEASLRTRSSRRAGFTLVELLVVVGIVALLMGILLPTLRSAREAANVAVCSSNLRQLYTGSLLYAQANHNYWPPAHTDFVRATGRQNYHRWHGERSADTGPFDWTRSPLRPYLQANAVLRCPSFEPTDGLDASAYFEASAGGYGYNHHYLGSSTGDDGVRTAAELWSLDAQNTPAKMNMIRRPAEKVAFADAAMALAGNVLIEYGFLEPPKTVYGYTSPSMHFRHRGRADVCWADGHVTSEPLEWTPSATNVYGADNVRAQLGFFGPWDNSRFERDRPSAQRHSAGR